YLLATADSNQAEQAASKQPDSSRQRNRRDGRGEQMPVRVELDATEVVNAALRGASTAVARHEVEVAGAAQRIFVADADRGEHRVGQVIETGRVAPTESRIGLLNDGRAIARTRRGHTQRVSLQAVQSRPAVADD